MAKRQLGLFGREADVPQPKEKRRPGRPPKECVEVDDKCPELPAKERRAMELSEVQDEARRLKAELQHYMSLVQGVEKAEKVVEPGGGAGVHQLLELQANHSWKYCFQVSCFSCHLIIASHE